MDTKIDLAKARYPDLSDHRVVIAGGTGAVGEGIVRAWLKAGAHVIVPSRTESKVERFRQAISDVERPENLDFVIGDYTGFEDAQHMSARIIEDHGAITDVIASIGGWWQGKKLWEISEKDWQSYFVDMATAHVATARAWVPQLSAKGSYQLILGGSAITPMAGVSIINMQQAGLLMMRQVLSKEVEGRQRIFSQVLGPVTTRMRKEYSSDWVSNDEVGLVSTGIAHNTDISGEDYHSENKEEMLQVLQKLGVYPK